MTDIVRAARVALVCSASALSFLASGAAMAQAAAPAAPAADEGIEEIIVTAQRQAESLQDVPVAVSAFSAEALDRQQIDNSSDLQLSLPNITYTKTNFTSSSFTIRGVGDLCVGVTCDAATAIHVNDMPLLSSRIFETEFFDMERIEVLRGPQGTLFGRNATSGVVNLITAKPNLNAFGAAGELEYGNYDSIKLKGMVNVPLSETLGVRLAGFYLNRDGYTKNLFNNSRIDGRDIYSVRGSVRWEPTDSTRIDLMGSYFREDDDRLRIQKQLCQRDPTGVLGCLPGNKDYGVVNGNASLASIFTSREFFSLRLGAPFAALGLGSLYGTDVYSGNVNPADARTVNTDYTPRYFSSELQVQGKIEQDIGQMRLQVSGLYQKSKVDSQQDYNLSVQNASTMLAGLTALQVASSTAGSPFQVFAPARALLIPNGPAGPYCTSQSDPNGVGLFGNPSAAFCSATPQDFDRSVQTNHSWTGEAILESQFDGALNFLVGGIYTDYKLGENSYYVNAFGLDYAAAILGGGSTLAARGAGNPAFPITFAGTPFYRNNTDSFSLKSYGLFGEVYYQMNDRLKVTIGLRYNHDKKDVSARTSLFIDSAGTAPLVPLGSSSFTQAVNYAALDFDATRTGLQPFQDGSVSFSRGTGRAVIDYKLTDDNLLYASYSRGYKSGGINPPLSPTFAVPVTFAPESVNAFEIGSKNSFANNTVQLNLTGFYYQYKNLQLSRIVSRTAVNDNVDANIYGLEAEAILRPAPGFLLNATASYLHTEVSKDKFLGNPRDPTGGRSDTVVIKDITNAANCTVVPNTAGAAGAAAANAFVGTVNTVGFASAGLRAPTAFPAGGGISGTGAFGVCAALQAAAAGNIGAFNPALAALQPALNGAFAGGVAGPLPFTVQGSGVPVNIKGNQLPQAPEYKLSAGAQYAFDFANGMSLVPRADISYTGKSYGLIFNDNIDRIKSYTVINAQVQLNGVDDKWFARAFVQNLTKNDAITGLGVGDQASGLFTNIFTLEPRRYGVTGGFRF